MEMSLLPGIDATASALNAERLRMDVVSQNIANAFNTKDTDGNPYQRKVVSFESVLQSETGKPGAQDGIRSVQVAGIHNDETPGQMVYNPSHPHANAEGMVEMPNVATSREMVDLITSSRSYEANLTVVRTARQMAQQAMRIGR
jgi:flagellar basal-body rod protein FlgC